MKAIAFSDDPSLLPPVITLFKSIDEVDAITFGDSADSVTGYGASKVFLMSDPAKSDAIADHISSKLIAKEYDYAFFVSTVNGRDVAGLVAGKTGLAAVAEISHFELSNGKSRTKRFFFGGKSILEEESDAHIFTVAPGIAEPVKSDQASAVEKLTLGESRIATLSSEAKQSGGVDIEKAQAIVSVGRGLGNKDGLALAESLASSIKGVVAGSRPVCLDYHWLSEDRQVGLSGKKVRPKVYIAVGISGQIQHIAGMRGSKVVVAINKDKSASIFEESDYGIVGDLYQVVPMLIDAMKR